MLGTTMRGFTQTKFSPIAMPVPSRSPCGGLGGAILVRASGNPSPVVVALPMLALDLAGEPERDFYLDVNGASRQRVSTYTAGTADLPIQLQASVNRICVMIDETTSLDISEAVQCITIVHIP